jgi:hypothetical protein
MTSMLVDLLQHVPAQLVLGDVHTGVTGVGADSRAVRPGEVLGGQFHPVVFNTNRVNVSALPVASS